MKLIKILVCVTIFFNFYGKLDALSGVGPIKFNNYTMDHFLAYIRGDGNSTGDVGTRKGFPDAFAVNPEGTYSYYYYCPTKYGSGGCAPAEAMVVQECSKRSKARGGSRCKLFARGYKVVWNGANIKFPRKFDEEMIFSVFKEKGWYGKETKNISSIDTTSTDENKYIQKKKDKKELDDTKTSKNDNIVKEIKDLKQLLDDGVITEAEFKEAKKKLLE